MGLLRKMRKRVFGRKGRPTPSFPGVRAYWDGRYRDGGTSGAGSAGRLALFKAQVLNDFVETHGIASVLELGCGDGSQLELARYPAYVGVDVSPTAIALCRARFAGDPTKRFCESSEPAAYAGTYDLVLSLDVIFHLVEDSVYEAYMLDLQRHAGRFIIIYSSNYNDDPQRPWAPHVRHRAFSALMDRAEDRWQLIEKIDNPYPFDDDINTSFADVYVYERTPSTGSEEVR